MKRILLLIVLIGIIPKIKAQTSYPSLSLFGNNPVASVNGFLNKIEFTGGAHGAIVFHPGQADELMFGLNIDGNFYWGTGQNATKPNYYSMFLNGSNGDLGVKGKITSSEVMVKIGGWADFVFENDYRLPSLIEVENHIKENGHLKDIPSANEVAKNGIPLGEMNSKLLQKIEELTLYAISQEKKIEELKSLNIKFIELEEKLRNLELKNCGNNIKK